MTDSETIGLIRVMLGACDNEAAVAAVALLLAGREAAGCEARAATPGV